MTFFFRILFFFDGSFHNQRYHSTTTKKKRSNSNDWVQWCVWVNHGKTHQTPKKQRLKDLEIFFPIWTQPSWMISINFCDWQNLSFKSSSSTLSIDFFSLLSNQKKMLMKSRQRFYFVYGFVVAVVVVQFNCESHDHYYLSKYDYNVNHH